MARKRAIKVSLDPGQLDHANWYLKNFDNCNSLQDVIRMFLSETHNAMTERALRQKESLRLVNMNLREQVQELAAEEKRLNEVIEMNELFMANHQNMISKAHEATGIGEDVPFIQVIEKIEHLIEKEKRLKQALASSDETLMKRRANMEKVYAAVGHEMDIEFIEVLKDIERLAAEEKRLKDYYLKYEAIINYLAGLERGLPFRHFMTVCEKDKEHPAILMVEDMANQEKQLRKEIDMLAEYFECAENGNIILSEAKEQLKTIASKLSVPDAMEHIVGRIDELSSERDNALRERGNALNEREDALKRIGSMLGMPNDGYPRTLGTILERIEYDRSDSQQKAQALDSLSNFQKQVIGALELDSNECHSFDDIVEELQRIIDVKERRERESQFFQRKANRPLIVIAWDRFKNFFNSLVRN